MIRSLYPKSWDQIAVFIKSLNGWRCANCGKQCRPTNQGKSDFAEGLKASGADEASVLEFLDHPTKWTLTVAHLNHEPSDCSIENLLPLCAPCHCRYDLSPRSMAIKKRLKRERHGQLRLPV